MKGYLVTESAYHWDVIRPSLSQLRVAKSPQNSGPGFSISCVAAPACTLARKRIAGVLSRPSYGLTALGPSGDCCQPNTGTGTASTNDSPVGLTKASGHKCINIAATTRIWNT